MSLSTRCDSADARNVSEGHWHGRNSIGVEIDPEYCRMAARYLKAESQDFFSPADLVFERAEVEARALVVKEDADLYRVRPARRSHLE